MFYLTRTALTGAIGAPLVIAVEGEALIVVGLVEILALVLGRRVDPEEGRDDRHGACDLIAPRHGAGRVERTLGGGVEKVALVLHLERTEG